MRKDLSANEMWEKIMGGRLDNMNHEKGIKLKLYMDILVLCCELDLWEPPNPTQFLELI